MASLTVPSYAANDDAPPASPTVAAPSVVESPVTPAPVAESNLDDIFDKAVDLAINDSKPLTPTMQSSVARAVSTNPDAEAEARRVALRTGVPVQTVFAQPDEMKRKVALDDIDFDSYERLYPTSALALTDLELAKIAHDDTENMGYTENILRGIGARTINLGAGLVRAGYTADKALVSLVAPDLVDYADSLEGLPGSGLLREAENATLGYTPRTTWDDVKQRPLAEFLPFALEQGLVSAPDMAAAIFVPGTYFTALTGDFAQERAENDERQGATLEDFLKVAPAAAVNALLERFATKGIIGVGEARRGLRQLGRAAVIAAAKEGSTEAVQNAAQYASETVGTKKGFSWGEAFEQAAQGVVAGAPFGGGVRIGSEGVKAVTERMQNRVKAATTAEQNARDFEQLNALAAESKLRQRDPLAFQNFIEQVAQSEGAVENVYIDPRALAQSGISLEELAKASPSIAEQARVALEIGGDVKIPVSEYASHLAGTELGQAMVDHLKTNPLGMSRAEAQEFMQSSADQLKADVEQVMTEETADDKTQKAVDQVRGDLLQKLTEANRFTQDVNEQYATLLSSFYKVQAGRLGLSPEEVYKQHPVDVKSTFDAGATLDQGDMFEHELANESSTLKEIEVVSTKGATREVTRGNLNSEGETISKSMGGLRNFWNTFKYSAIKDDQGRPQVLYHGTKEDFEAFELGRDAVNSTNLGTSWTTKRAGIFFSPDKSFAQTFAGKDGKVVKAYLNIENPADFTKMSSDLEQELADNGYNTRMLWASGLKTWELFDHDNGGDVLVDALKQAGYDGAIIYEEDQNGNDVKSYVAFNPNQIKSTANRGSFNPSEPSILRQEGDTARGSFNPDTNTITLLRNADLSTFLHESGHFFLETMNKLAQQVDTPDALKKDMQAVFDWLGVKDITEWNSHDLEWQREKHEQFARGFEAYLFEGKSPSFEMRSVFARFRSWLLNVYRQLRNLNVELSDEVRGVFDRMLATDEQIKETELARSFEPMFKDAKTAGMTEAEWQDYQELGLQATRDATTELSARTMRDMKWLSNAKSRALKDLQREAAGRRREIREQVTKEIMSEPVNQAREFITKGKFEIPEDANQTVKRMFTEAGLGKTKLSLPALKEMYGTEANAPWRYFSTGKFGEAAEDGLHPDQVAEMFGFTSGDQLVRELLAAENAKERIAALTDQRMLEKYGDLTSPDALAKAADEAVHNEARTRFVATEMNALQKAIGGRKILAEAAKRFADSMIDRLRVRDINPARYSAAESRAARAADKALRNGNLTEAAVEKRNQLIQNYASRAAHKGLAEADKALRYFKKFERAGARENIDVSYLDQIDALLERFDLRKSVTLKALDKRKSLLDWKAAQEDLGLEPDIAPALLNEAMRKSYKDMTLEEMRGLRDAIKQIEHLGRLKNRLLTAKDNRDFQTTVDQLVASINKHAGGRVVDNRTRASRASDVGRLFKGFVASHRKVASLARELDGIKDGGPVWDTLIRSMNEAGDMEATMRSKATKDLAKLVKPLLAEGRMGGKGIYFKSIDKSLNREERIGIALNTGNAGNLQRLLDGEGWALDQVRPVLDSLTKADWDFVQSVWDFFETFRPQIGAKEKRVYGKEPDWVEPLPVQTKFGAYRGGYYPIEYDSRRSIAAEQHSDAEFAKQQMKGAYTTATTRRSFTKARADEVTGRPLLYALDGLYTGVNDVIHDLAWHEWLIDANRLLRNRALDGAIRNGYGAEVVRQFKSAVQDIAGGEMPSGTAFEKAIGDLRAGAVVAGLGFNIVNSVINLSGVTNSIVRIGPRWMAQGVGKFSANPKALIAEVHSKSEMMRNRSKTMMREINEIQSMVRGKSRARSVADTMMFAPLTMTQMAVDTPTWWGAYQKALAEGRPEEKAVKQADQAVLDSQSGGQVKDLSAIQRGPALMKLFTTFYGYFNAAYNLGVERTKATNFKDPISVLKLGGDYLMLYSIPAVMGTLIKNALVGTEDDWEPEKLASTLANEQLSYIFGLMVGLREVTGAVQTVAGVNPYPADYGGPAGLRFFNEFYNLATQINQGEADEALFKSTMNLLGIFFKLPAAQINRTVLGTAALIDGETENPAAVVAGPPKK